MRSLHLKRNLRANLDPAGKYNFLRTLPPRARLLDVGCGNSSASLCKGYRSDLEYVGIDVGDYNILPEDKALMNRYIVCPPERFAECIQSLEGGFDGVLSSHNLEHCRDPWSVLDAMCAVLGPEGRLYLSFPSEASAGFPSREGCLNFHDDPTHVNLFRFDTLVSAVVSRNLRVERAVPRNRGRLYLPFLLGALQEPRSRRAGRVLRGTWYYWGFESVIVARKHLRSPSREGPGPYSTASPRSSAR